MSPFFYILDYCHIKPGRTPQDAIDNFDLTICGVSFYGGNDWVVPDPELSFACKTTLQSTTSNRIIVQYIDNLYKQANRCLHEVVHEMRLHKRMLKNGHSPSAATMLLRSAIDILQPNVFLSEDRWPVFPFTHPTKDISFLRLVCNIKCHLILKASLELFRQGYNRNLCQPGRRCTICNYKTAVCFHNEVVERYVSRFEKYTARGITIIGPELEKYKQCGVFRKVDNVHQMSRGVYIFVRPDYYYNVDDSIDESKIGYFKDLTGQASKDKSKSTKSTASKTALKEEVNFDSDDDVIKVKRNKKGSKKRAPKQKKKALHIYDSDSDESSSPPVQQKKKQKRIPYSKEEKDTLLMGVERFGTGEWVKIRSYYDEVFSVNNRSNVNLKDLYRTLTKDA